jgi:hypothetical protein
MSVLTWGEFRTQIRRSILIDESPGEAEEYRWSDESLRDCLWWAMDTFACHTAQASSVNYDPATGVVYDLPDNLFTGESLDVTGLVCRVDETGDRTYYNPVQYTEGLNPLLGHNGFYTYPYNVLHLTTAPGTGYWLEVRYFAFYTHPMADKDTIDIPRWGQLALAYLVGAHALSGAGIKSAKIAEWRRKPDTGNPIQNPLKEMEEYFFKLYEREMARLSTQNRVNHFRVG